MTRERMPRWVVTIVAILAFPALATVYTSASYVQDGLVAQWDAIDNEGTGTHNPAATVWKDLKGNRDLKLQGNGSWRRGSAFYTAGAGAVGTNAAPKYLTIEVLCRVDKDSSRILFWSGNDRTRYVVFDHANLAAPYCRAYFDGSNKTATQETIFARVVRETPIALAATYDASDTVTEVFCDGIDRSYEMLHNTWKAGHTGIVLGDRKITGDEYPWTGEIYSIRLYDRVLTQEELVRNYKIDVKRFYTSAMYDKEGMVAFWDALENAGEGTHDSSAAIWKNLIDGGPDLTLNASVWSDIALVCNGTTKSGAYGTNTLALNSMEILFRHERPDSNQNAWLFSNGIDRYCVLGQNRIQWQNYFGIQSTSDFILSRAHGGMHAAAWTNPGPGATTNAYIDGELSTYEARPKNPRTGELDDWGAGGVVGLGSRWSGGQHLLGRIYTARAYSTLPTAVQIRRNHKLDTARYANTLRWKGTDGAFGAPGNWIDIDSTQEIPGEDNTVDLPSGTYKISLDANQTVAALWANNGNALSCAPIDATLDLCGHTLTVLGMFSAESIWGRSGRFASLTLTNGTFKAEAVHIGAIYNYIPCDPKIVAQDAAFNSGSGSLLVEGPDTTVTIRKGVDLDGPFTRLRVAGGATFACDRLRSRSMQYQGSDYAPGVYDRAQIEITGAGTKATLGSMWMHRDVDVTFSDGADITLLKSSESFSSVGWASCIGRSCEGFHGNSTHMVVDNASLTMRCDGFIVGASHNGSGGPGSSLTVQNGSTLMVTNIKKFVVGASRNGEWGRNSNSTNSVFKLLSGSDFRGAATTLLAVGGGGSSSFNGMVVSNATATCGTLNVGLLASGTYSYYSSNDYLRVAGPTARISALGTETNSICLRMGTRLTFALPAGGFDAPPLTSAGGVTVMADEQVVAVDPVKLVIDPSAYDADRKGRSQTLISCATDSTESFQRLIDNLVVVNANHFGELSIEDGGTKLVYTGLNGRTILIFR